MKQYAALWCLLLGLSCFAQEIRPITQINDINRVGQEFYTKPVQWFAGDSIRFDVYATDGRNPIDLSSGIFPVLYVSLETNVQQVYLVQTGIVVNGTSGHVRVSVPAQRALLSPTNSYASWMTVYRVEGGATNEIATVAYSATKVLPAPNGTTYSYLTPTNPPFQISIGAVLVNPTNWSLYPAKQVVNLAGYALTNAGVVHGSAAGLSNFPSYLARSTGQTFSGSVIVGNPAAKSTELSSDELVLRDTYYAGNDHVKIRKGTSGAADANVLYKLNSFFDSYTTNKIWTSDTDGYGSGLDADTLRGLADDSFARRTNFTSVTFFAPIILRDVNSNQVATLTATGGLKVGASSFSADLSGNIAQDATNTASLGVVTGISFRAASITGAVVGAGAFYGDGTTLSGVATGSPVYAESDPLWIDAETGYVTKVSADLLYAKSDYHDFSGNITAKALDITNSAGRINIGGAPTKGILFAANTNNVTVLYINPNNTNAVLDMRSNAIFRIREQSDETGKSISISKSAIILKDDSPEQVLSITVTGGLRVGQSVFVAKPSGDISQSPTNYSSMGIVSGVSFRADAFTGTVIGAGTFYGDGSTLSGVATGAPLYAFTETDSVWTAASTGYLTKVSAASLYATGSPVYAESDPLAIHVETDSVWTAASTGYLTRVSAAATYATGTPLYVFTETDSVWTAASTGYLTKVSAAGTYATGTPLYAFTELDPKVSNTVLQGAALGLTAVQPGASITNLTGYGAAATRNVVTTNQADILNKLIPMVSDDFSPAILGVLGWSQDSYGNYGALIYSKSDIRYFLELGTAANSNATDFATAAQGTTADSAYVYATQAVAAVGIIGPTATNALTVGNWASNRADSAYVIAVAGSNLAASAYTTATGAQAVANAAYPASNPSNYITTAALSGYATGTPIYVETGTGTLIAASIAAFMPGAAISNEFLSTGTAATVYQRIDTVTQVVNGITVTNLSWSPIAASSAIRAGTYGVTNVGWVQLNEQDQDIPASSVYVTNSALSFRSPGGSRQTVWTSGNMNPVTVPSGNTNYWRIVSPPASSGSFGAWGYLSYDSTNIYIYHAASSRWLRVAGTLSW